MRVRDLRSALEDVKGIFQDAQAKSQQKDIQALLQLLDGREDQDLGQFLDSLRATFDPSYVDEAVVSCYITRLIDAGTSDTAFTGVLKQLENDRRVRRQELVLIAQRHFGKRRHIKARDSIRKIHEMLRIHFNEMRYEKESRVLARRATPV